MLAATRLTDGFRNGVLIWRFRPIDIRCIWNHKRQYIFSYNYSFVTIWICPSSLGCAETSNESLATFNLVWGIFMACMMVAAMKNGHFYQIRFSLSPSQLISFWMQLGFTSVSRSLCKLVEVMELFQELKFIENHWI